MAYEDISGTRIVWTDYRGGNVAAASTVRPPEFNGIVMAKPFTITGITHGTGTTPPACVQAGGAMGIRIWVNQTRKGLATLPLTPGGSLVNTKTGLVFTGPANSVVSLSISSVGASIAGVGHRYAIHYCHGWSA